MNFTSYQKYIVASIPIILIGLIMYYFSDIVSYIILAWVLSMIAAPLHNFFKRFVGKTIAAGMTLFTFTLLLVAVLSIFIPPVVQQARVFANVDYNQLIKGLEEPINDWNDWLVDKGILEGNQAIPAETLAQESTSTLDNFRLVEVDSLLKKRGDSLRTGVTLLIDLNHDNPDDAIDQSNLEVLASDSFFDHVKKNLYQFLDPSKIPELFGSVVGFFGNMLVAIMSIFFIAFFFLKEQGLFSKMIKAVVPNKFEDGSIHAIDESANLLIRYFIGVLIQITIITIFVSSTLKFLGFQNALLIGFFAALMNVIPYVGPIIGATFGMIITISSNLDPGVSFYNDILPDLGKLVLVFASMQMIDNFIIQPNIFSKSVKAHPLEIFIIILIGAKLGGILGMVLAIPIYTVLRVVAKVFLSEFKIVQKITQGL